jgi:2-amino-4-hydroxy-6-hydroxymethyldihydropteridine diphosphokinase
MRALLSLGSNIGDRVGNLLLACSELRNLGDVMGVAPLYETSPVGDVVQDDFLNTAVLFETPHKPLELLAALHRIEEVLGRTRDIHWGPRTLDIDIIDIEGFASDLDELHIPHRCAHQRKFVLQPAADVAPEWKISGHSIATLFECLNTDDEVRAFDDSRWVVAL